MPERTRAAVVALTVVGLVAGGAAAGAQTTPTVDPGDATVAAGETTTVAVTLSATTDGLAGFNLTVETTDGTARVVGASVAADYGITTERVEDGRATLEGVDIDENVRAGATDVRLGTVTVRGESAGETDLSASVRRMDDDDGDPVSPETEPAALTVTGGSDASTATAAAGGGDDGGPTSTGTPGTTESAGTQTSPSDGEAAAGAREITGIPSNVVAVALVALLVVVSFVAGLAAGRFR
ncbi:hypothetical protein BRD02_08995 [Halobacteriales archaeon QS_8_69_73]|nr:MAG: hypothetical protein BRD02_08995 [Halobacteriales archaeon QS_8_69_73]